MVFLVLYVIALGAALIQNWIRKNHGSAARENSLNTLLFFCYGIGGLVGFVTHYFFPDLSARNIGWQAGNPFQQEVAFAGLSIAVLGLASWRASHGFRRACVLQGSVYFLGAASIHVRETLLRGNFATDNFITILPDFLIPLTILALAIVPFSGLSARQAERSA